MTNPYYNPTGNPAAGSEGLSALIRNEFASIGDAFDLIQISTTGAYSTVFAQQGSYTFTLPAVVGTLALQSDVANSIGRNRLHNSQFLVNQRGTTFSGAGYWSDRWLISNSAGTPSGSVGASNAAYGSSQVLSAVCALGSNNAVAINQRIPADGCADLSGGTITVSAYMSASTSAGALGNTTIALYSATAPDNFASVTLIASAIVAVNGTPGRYSATFSGLDASILNGVQVSFIFSQQSGSGTLTANIGGTQTEKAAAVTALEWLDPTLQNMQCWRFYQHFPNYSLSGYAPASDVIIYGAVPLSPPMRAIPTVTFSSIEDSFATALSVNTAESQMLLLEMTTTAGGNAVSSATVMCSADL